MKEMTRRREMALKDFDRRLKIVTINECQFDELYEKCDNKALKEEIELEIETTFMDPRSFYFGGRVNAIVLLEELQREEFEMKYFDFTSLYPSVMKTERYPLGKFFFFV
jgi:hypothetical protein